MNTPLGNCPFCLSSAVGLYIGGVQPNCTYKVHCKTCRANGPTMTDQTLAIAAWTNCMAAVADAYQHGLVATPLDILVKGI